MSELHLFSTGTLTATLPDGSAVEFALLQDIAVEFKAAKKELRAPASVSLYPVDVGHTSADVTMKAKNAAIKADALAALCGVSVNTLTGAPVVTLDRVVALPSMVAVFTTADTAGSPVTLTVYDVCASGVQIPFKMEDFAMPDFELVAYGRHASGKIAEWSFG